MSAQNAPTVSATLRTAVSVTPDTLVSLGGITVQSTLMSEARITFATEIARKPICRIARLIHTHSGRAYLCRPPSYTRPTNVDYIVVEEWNGTKAYQKDVPDQKPLDTNAILPNVCFKASTGRSGLFAKKPEQDDIWAVTEGFTVEWIETGQRPPRPVMWYCTQGDVGAEHHAFDDDLQRLLQVPSVARPDPSGKNGKKGEGKKGKGSDKGGKEKGITSQSAEREIIGGHSTIKGFKRPNARHSRIETPGREK